MVTVGPLAGCRLVHNDQGRFEGIALVDFVEDGDVSTTCLFSGVQGCRGTGR